MPLDSNNPNADTPHERTVHLASQGWRYGCSSVVTGDDAPRGGQTRYAAHPWSANAGRLIVTDWLPRSCCHSERENDAACEGCVNRGEAAYNAGAAAAREACAQPRPAEPAAAEEEDDLYWRLHAMSKSLEGSGRLDEHENPDAYATVLDAMAFVQQHEACATPHDRAKWYFKQVEPSGTVVARAPDGRGFVVKNGDFDTSAGRELLNAMIAALSGPQLPLRPILLHINSANTDAY